MPGQAEDAARRRDRRHRTAAPATAAPAAPAAPSTSAPSTSPSAKNTLLSAGFGPSFSAITSRKQAEHLRLHFVGALEALVRVLVAGAQEEAVDRVELLQDRLVAGAGQRVLVAGDDEPARRRLARRRVGVGAALVEEVHQQDRQRAPDRVEVGDRDRVVDRFRRDKALGAEDQAALVADLAHRAEVDELHPVAVDHHVVGLHVVMGEAGGVQVGEGGAERHQIGERLLGRQHAVFGHVGDEAAFFGLDVLAQHARCGSRARRRAR